MSLQSTASTSCLGGLLQIRMGHRWLRWCVKSILIVSCILPGLDEDERMSISTMQQRYAFSTSSRLPMKLIQLQAVEWAIARDVDIISISWTTTVNHDCLRNAIDNAYSKSIIVIGSTADEGKDGGDIYPAGWPVVLTVSALDAAGRRRGVSQKTVDLLVLGEDVPANGPNYITAKSKENVSGSSVATALASGIASLLLVCTRLANMNPEHWMYFRQRKVLLSLFKLMHNNDNHIKPSLLFRDGFKIKHPKDAWTKIFCHPDNCLSPESAIVEQTIPEIEPSPRSTTFYPAVSVQ